MIARSSVITLSRKSSARSIRWRYSITVFTSSAGLSASWTSLQCQRAEEPQLMLDRVEVRRELSCDRVHRDDSLHVAEDDRVHRHLVAANRTQQRDLVAGSELLPGLLRRSKLEQKALGKRLELVNRIALNGSRRRRYPARELADRALDVTL